MTAWIWLVCPGCSPYSSSCGREHLRFDVDTALRAQALYRAHHPAGPAMDALVVLDCDYTSCMTRLQLPQCAAVTDGRETARKRSAWFVATKKQGRRSILLDHCSLHSQPRHSTDGQPPASLEAGGEAEQIGLFP